MLTIKIYRKYNTIQYQVQDDNSKNQFENFKIQNEIVNFNMGIVKFKI